MPSMKCYECKKVKRCAMYLERDEREATVAVYYCRPCARQIRVDKLAADQAAQE